MDEHTKQRGRRELETEILEKVGDTISTINEAKHVDEVICALHSFAVCLFPLDPSLISGSIDSRYRDQVLNIVVPSSSERDEWRHTFYQGSAFPTLARVLIYNVASNWLACFPFSARKHVYDSFFLGGPPIQIVQVLLPALSQDGSKNEEIDFNAVCLNVHRILVLFLLDMDGIHQMAGEFADLARYEEFSNGRLQPDTLVFISKVAQQVASIPDKARTGAPAALSSHSFFKQIVIQLLAGAEERALELSGKTEIMDKMDGTFVFVGETFARICRRGCAEILIVEIMPRVLELARGFLSVNVDTADANPMQSDPRALFWVKMMEVVKDPYAVEKMSEQLLRVLDAENASDVEAYWCLWILFHRTFRTQTSMRSMFSDKFLLWKIFPVCALRWILQFSVLKCPPSSNELKKGHHTQALLDRVQCMVKIWSTREFIQKAPIEQQAYVTAAIGLLMEKMSKDELESTKDVMHMILQGVSCRLESPIHLVRAMASSVAFVFSKVIDPNNLLYLDDICTGETIDWEFGLTSNKGGKASSASVPEDKQTCPEIGGKQVKHRHKNLSEFKFVDPDEIIDPATLNSEDVSDEDEDEDEDASVNSEMSGSSLQPYDLSDDDTDLKRNFSQLVDIVGALRKPDDPDGVERALVVAEDLVRASPDELRHVAGELVTALVQVRCSDVTVEGEEDTAEHKRQKALTALLVTCPFESLDALNKLLYSASVDISQRVLILDTMTDGAQELANAKSVRSNNYQQRGLISTMQESQPWFTPSSKGPQGAGPWKEVPETGGPLSWSYRYERELPLRPSQIKIGKSRKWSLHVARRQGDELDHSNNKFPMYAAAFMLPAMQGFDKRRHGVDLLGADFFVLGKLIYMLGICMRCTAMHPEASALAPYLLDLLSSRVVSHHAEVYVRRSVLFAASCVLIALHPTFVASALSEGNLDVSKGLEWIRSWSLHVAESDTDTECSSMAMACLQLHAELALQASRALEITDSTIKEKGLNLPPILSKGAIRIGF